MRSDVAKGSCFEQVNAVLFEGKSPVQAMNDLMMRDKKIEITDDIEWEKPDR